jgi:hypothetical protein
MQTSNDIDRDDRAYQAAEKRAEELQGFYIHLLVYVVVNAGLFVINVLSRGENGSWWFYWPLTIWGLALAIHALATFGGVFGPRWKERKTEELYERNRREGSAA